jgi:hypothetical protein
MPKRDMYAAADAGQALTYEAKKKKKKEERRRRVPVVDYWFLEIRRW